ncbi:MAG: hypothetical protein NTW34_06485, partial [Actinobacteria bacterium]|nr:hypothetical protein [Actinomycetota bacterium]
MRKRHMIDLTEVLIHVEQLMFQIIDSEDQYKQRQSRIALKEFNRQLSEKNLVIKKLQDELLALQNVSTSSNTSEIVSLDDASEISHHSDSMTGSWFNEKKVTVYTVRLNGLPRLESIPSELLSNFVFICFSDSPAEIPAGWEYRPISFWGSSDNATVSWAKSHPDLLLKGYEFSLWLEPNQVSRLMKNLSQFQIGEFADSYSTATSTDIADVPKLLSQISNISVELADSLKSKNVLAANLLDSRLILQRVDSLTYKRLNRLAWKIQSSTDLTDNECWTLSALALELQVKGIIDTGLQKKKVPNHPPGSRFLSTGKFF